MWEIKSHFCEWEFRLVDCNERCYWDDIAMKNGVRLDSAWNKYCCQLNCRLTDKTFSKRNDIKQVQERDSVATGVQISPTPTTKDRNISFTIYTDHLCRFNNKQKWLSGCLIAPIWLNCGTNVEINLLFSPKQLLQSLIRYADLKD